MEPGQRSCRKCGTPLIAGVNCTEGRIARCDYICQACYRDVQRPYQREWARKQRGGLRGPRPPYMTAGGQYGRWTLLEDARTSDDLVLCRCACGTEKPVDAGSVRRGLSQSCGCLRDEVAVSRSVTHGLSGHPLFGTWYNMVSRCTRPAAVQYADYGGRGITVCARWLGPDGPANFIADMGPKPSPGHSLDRWPDNDGNYEQGNCRWATDAEQRRNTRPRVSNAEHAQALAEIERLHREVERLHQATQT